MRRRGHRWTRRLVQLSFLALVVVAVFVVGGNAERYCPFGGVEALHAYVTEGQVPCSLGVSNFFLLGGVLLSVLLLKRAFCSHACPIGTVQELVGAAARRLGIPGRRVGAGPDRILSALKIVVLVLVVAWTWRVGELVFRGYDPCYALLSRHGEDITFWAYVVSGAILLGAVFLSVPFCRWLCPLAVVMNPFSRAAAGRVARDAASCADCGRCADACPMGIAVHREREIRAARCTACLECVDACPKRGAGTLAFRLPLLGARLGRGAVAGGFVLVITGAVLASQLFPFPSFTWTRGRAPGTTAVLELRVEGLTCRGRANLLRYYLDRDDDLAVPGYLRTEAWPGPGAARLRILYDPEVAEASGLADAILEPCYDAVGATWRPSPFRIPGYDPLAPVGR